MTDLALYEGGPKPPEVHHKPFHRLAWRFHSIRYEHTGDRYFDPWAPKHLKSCQRIMETARGDEDEVGRRMRNLWAWCRVNPNFYRFTPECLLSRWDDCHAPPIEAVGGKAALKQESVNRGRQAAKERIWNGHAKNP